MGLKGISFGVETARQRERECDKERQRLCTREREREAILFFVSSLLSHIHSIRMRNKESSLSHLFEINARNPIVVVVVVYIHDGAEASLRIYSLSMATQKLSPLFFVSSNATAF